MTGPKGPQTLTIEVENCERNRLLYTGWNLTQFQGARPDHVLIIPLKLGGPLAKMAV